jgi:hypothetical protein
VPTLAQTSLIPGVLLLATLAGCASPPPPPHEPPPLVMTWEAYLEWRGEQRQRAAAELKPFGEVAASPGGDWPTHLKGQSVSFLAHVVSIQPEGATETDPIAGRQGAIVLLGDPENERRNRYFFLDGQDYREDAARFDGFKGPVEGQRGALCKVTAYMTGAPEDFLRSPWIGRIVALEVAAE